MRVLLGYFLLHITAGAKMTVTTTATTVREGTEAVLTCTFKDLPVPILTVVWTDSNGAKVAGHIPDKEGSYSTNVGSTTAGKQQAASLTLDASIVTATTFYKCEIWDLEGDDDEDYIIPYPLKAELYVYSIIGNSRTTIQGSDVLLKCSFSFILKEPTDVYWKYSQTRVSSEEPKRGAGDDVTHVVDKEKSGFEPYSTTSRTLITTLHVASNDVYTTYTCGVKVEEEEVKELALTVDVFYVERVYKEARSKTEVFLTCVFKGMQNELNIFWSQGKGGEMLSEGNSREYTIQDTSYNAAKKSQTSVITIPSEANSYSSDYYCSVLDIDTYRETKVKLGIFHIGATNEVYQEGLEVTLSCLVTSLRYPITVEWRDSRGETYSSQSLGDYGINNGVYLASESQQAPTFTIPAELNHGTESFTCIVTPDPCQNAAAGCLDDEAEDGNARALYSGEYEVSLVKLENSGSQCMIDLIRFLHNEAPVSATKLNVPSPCFSIRSDGDYPVSDSQTYVSAGNNLEIAPLPIYAAGFGDNLVFRCTTIGWDRYPPGCASSIIVDNMSQGACSTQGLFPPKEYHVINGFTVADPDYTDTETPEVYYTHVESGTVVTYEIRNKDCYVFVVEGSEEKTTTCTDGAFTPDIAPVKKVCCDTPTFAYGTSPDAEFCVVAEPALHTDVVNDELLKKTFVKNGKIVYFDNRCRCFESAWQNVTCHEGAYYSGTWDIPSIYNTSVDIVKIGGRDRVKLPNELGLESFCCKVPNVLEDLGLPLNNLSDAYYILRDSGVSYSCSKYCYRMKSAYTEDTCTKHSPTLLKPVCEVDPSCCPPVDDINTFIVGEMETSTWTLTHSGGRVSDTVGEASALRRCYYSEWDLIKYKNIVIDEEAVNATIQTIESEDCSILHDLVSLNITEVQYKAVLQRFYAHSFTLSDSDVTTKEEKVNCYNTMRYILLDPWRKGHDKFLNQTEKDRFIITTANVLNEWIKIISDTIRRVFSYASVKTKVHAASFYSSKTIYNGWMVALSANLDVGKSFIWTMLRTFFPNTTHSDIVSPVVWLDLPLNSTLTGIEQYIIVNFTSAKALDSTRHYSCGVYYIGEWENGLLNQSNMEDGDPEWQRGSCDNVTVEFNHQSVICKCSSWKLFVAVTMTQNTTSDALTKYLVGNTASSKMLEASNGMHAAAILPLAVVFLLLCTADTRRKPLMHCRLHILVCMVGTHLLALISYWMEPANISCVYIMYIYEIFALATVVWLSVEMVCISKCIRTKNSKISKMFAHQSSVGVYVLSFLIPSICIVLYKTLNTRDGARTFAEPFDAQRCWFNKDKEFLQFLLPLYTLLFAGIPSYSWLLVVFFTKKGADGVAMSDLLATGIMYGWTVLSWLLVFFRGNNYIQYTANTMHAIQGIVGFICYVGLTRDVKMSLFPGFYLLKDETEKKDLLPTKR